MASRCLGSLAHAGGRAPPAPLTLHGCANGTTSGHVLSLLLCAQPSKLAFKGSGLTGRAPWSAATCGCCNPLLTCTAALGQLSVLLPWLLWTQVGAALYPFICLLRRRNAQPPLLRLAPASAPFLSCGSNMLLRWAPLSRL